MRAPPRLLAALLVLRCSCEHQCGEAQLQLRKDFHAACRRVSHEIFFDSVASQLSRRAACVHSCMGFQEGAVEPVRTCPPTACTELRTGWKASWVCRCNDNASALLNCAG